MQNNLLTELFRTLLKRELRDLDSYLRSPYHNRRNDVILLFNHLRGTGSLTSFDKIAAHEAVFPGQSFDDKQLRYTVSFLYTLIKDWLTLQAFYEDKNYQNVILVRSLRKKGLKKVFEKEHLNSLEKMSNHALWDEHHHLYLSELHFEGYSHVVASSRSEMTGFKEWHEEWTMNFVAGRLRQALAAQSHQVMTGININLELMPETVSFLEAQKGSLPPDVEILFCCFQALSMDDSFPYFEDLHVLLGKHGHLFPKEELLNVYRAAINYCIRRVNSGEELFKHQVFKLYKEGLAQGIFIENGFLSRFMYKNIVANALGLKEFEWAASFIEGYRERIEPKFRHSAYHFNLALLHFVKNESDLAMLHLLEVGTDDVPNNLNARRMLLRIYFDKRELQALESHLDSFRTYIYRRSDLGYLKELYLNLIKFARRLLHLEPNNAAQATALRNEIETTKLVAEKEWLLSLLNDRQNA